MKRKAAFRTAALLLCGWLLLPAARSFAVDMPGGMGGAGGMGGSMDSSGDFEINQGMLIDTEAMADSAGDAMESAMADSSLAAAAAAYGASGGGGGGGGGSASRTVSHSKSTVTSTLAYNALTLTQEAEDTTCLSLGDEALTLTLANRQGNPAVFTTALACWNENGLEILEEPDEGTVNALVLTAREAQAFWQFDGTVLKKLADSGVKHLVLRAGDTVLALPTSGFVAGLKQDQWKSRGLTGKYFTYTAAMGDGTAALALTVSPPGEQPETCSLTEDNKQLVFYTQNLLLGGPELLTRPMADPE